jgi:hypothetical protein
MENKPRVSTALAQDLKLSVELISEGEDQWVSIKLMDDLNLAEVQTDYLLTPFSTNDRRYHFREALVIAMRRLVGQAVVEGMISDYPGTHWIWNTPPTKSSSPTISLTELEL